MDGKKLNVYITTYNRSEYLKKSIDSVLAQTYKDYDLFILDNCSDDDTEAVVKSYDDPRIHYIRHEKNLGGLYNYQYAVRHNKAEYYIVFHDDDTMNPDMLESEVNYLDTHPDVSIVSSVSDHIDETGASYKGDTSATEILMTKQNIEEIVLSGEGFFKSYFYEGINIVYPSIMYRDRFMKANNLSPAEEAGPSRDTQLLFEIERTGGKSAILNKPLMNTRMHKDQDSFVNFGIMYEKLFNYLRKDPYYADLLEKYKSGCHQLYKRLSRIIAVNLIKGKFDKEKAKDCEYRIWKAIGGKRIDKFKYTAITTVYRCFPRLVRKKTENYLAGRM